jgi:hypothetical protein
MQAPVRKRFLHAVGLVVRMLGRPLRIERIGGRRLRAEATLPQLGKNPDRPMIRPSPQQQAAIRAHREDWP